jgi:hypothetical protein
MIAGPHAPPANLIAFDTSAVRFLHYSKNVQERQ